MVRQCSPFETTAIFIIIYFSLRIIICELKVLDCSTFFYCLSVSRMRATYTDKWIIAPKTKEELDDCRHEFNLFGLTGAFSFQDGVHIYWRGCSANLKHHNTGKEGYPTRTFQVHVNWRRRIMSVSTGQSGSINDKTAIQHDPLIQRVLTEPLFTQHEFQLCDDQGAVTTLKGVYVIVDGTFTL